MPAAHAAIMFADVSGSSSLFKQLGDVEARAIIGRVVAMMMAKTREHHGRVIKTIGDECMSAFASAEEGASAAMAIQQDISRNDYGVPLAIRIGLHFGAVIEEHGDVFGEAVNDAAALVKVAKGEQIITSEPTRASLPEPMRLRCQLFDAIRIKGGVEQARIFLLQWEDEDGASNATMFMSAINPALLSEKPLAQTLRLHYLGKTFEITEKNVPFTIGREVDNDLMVKFRMASRQHCKIDYSRGKFVLIDNSTNGTYVLPEGRTKIYLRREEVPLVGSGVISFSPEPGKDGTDLIEYSC